MTLSPAYIKDRLDGIEELKSPSTNHIPAGVLLLLFEPKKSNTIKGKFVSLGVGKIGWIKI